MGSEESYPMKLILSPSILSCDFLHLQEEIESVKSTGVLHLDIMDGHFVPNLTFGDALIRSMANGFPKLFLDVHLMINNAPEMIERILEIEQVQSITFHYEGNTHHHRLIERIKKANKKAGLALNPGTSVNVVDESLLCILDLLLIMSVNPGFGGQNFIPSTFSKLQKLATLADRPSILQVDGGISKNNIGALAKLGANNFVIGSALFNLKSSMRFAYLQELQDIYDKALKE